MRIVGRFLEVEGEGRRGSGSGVVGVVVSRSRSVWVGFFGCS